MDMGSTGANYIVLNIDRQLSLGGIEDSNTESGRRTSGAGAADFLIII